MVTKVVNLHNPALAHGRPASPSAGEAHTVAAVTGMEFLELAQHLSAAAGFAFRRNHS